MFTLDADHNITIQDTAAVREGTISFSTQQEFGAKTARWTTAQFVELWNSFAGAPPFGNLRSVTKFMDRTTAIKRIWNALQTLPASAGVQDRSKAPMTTTSQQQVDAPLNCAAALETLTSSGTAKKLVKTAETKKAAAAPKLAREPKQKAAVGARAAAEGSRKETILALTGRTKGATLAELMSATGWQAHSVRGFISTLGSKHGCVITSSKNAAGERIYQGS